jgi:sucrose-6-phosphate hydrolase SacC (GH32 family)
VDAGRLGVRVLVDRSSVEVFTGTTAITSLVFPRAGSTGLRLEVEGGEALVVRLTADALGSPFAGSTAD